MGNSANRTDRAATRQERATEVLRLRREERLTHEEIGKLFGINKSSAWALEQLGLDLLREKTIDQAQKWRKRLNTHIKAEVEDLHEMLDSWRESAKADADALDKFVKIHAQLTSKYTVLAKLNGSMAPEKHELAGKDGGPLVIEGASEDVIGKLDRLAASLRAGGTDPKPQSN
jgi:hypothetical protein